MFIAVVPNKQDLQEIKSHYKALKKSKNTKLSDNPRKSSPENTSKLLSNCSTVDGSYYHKNDLEKKHDSSSNCDEANASKSLLEMDLDNNYCTIMENLKQGIVSSNPYDYNFHHAKIENNDIEKSKIDNKYCNHNHMISHSDYQCGNWAISDIQKIHDADNGFLNNDSKEFENISAANKCFSVIEKHICSHEASNFKDKKRKNKSSSIIKVSYEEDMYSKDGPIVSEGGQNSLSVKNRKKRIEKQTPSFNLKNNIIDLNHSDPIVEKKKVIFEAHELVGREEIEDSMEEQINFKECCCEEVLKDETENFGSKLTHNYRNDKNDSIFCVSEERNTAENGILCKIKHHLINKQFLNTYLMSHNTVTKLISDTFYSSDFTESLSDSSNKLIKHAENPKSKINLNEEFTIKYGNNNSVENSSQTEAGMKLIKELQQPYSLSSNSENNEFNINQLYENENYNSDCKIKLKKLNKEYATRRSFHSPESRMNFISYDSNSDSLKVKRSCSWSGRFRSGK